MNNLAIIIPAAGIGRRMKSYGSKSLLPLSDGRSILRRQIDMLRLIWKDPEIVVIVGFDSDKVIKSLPDGIRVVENEKYEETGVGRSISMGLRATASDKCLIIYGDLVFNKATFDNIENKSTVIIDTQKRLPSSEVGIIIDNHKAIHFDYGLPTKWCSIVLLVGKELALFKSLGSHLDRKKMAGHEVLNAIIDRGGEFICLESKKMRLVEVDSTKDLIKAKKICV